MTEYQRRIDEAEDYIQNLCGHHFHEMTGEDKHDVAARYWRNSIYYAKGGRVQTLDYS